jgi:hypothetical protein
MSDESAITEEDNFDSQDLNEDSQQAEQIEDDYDIEEPEGDEEFKVPVIDDLDDEEEQAAAPVKEDKPSKPAAKPETKAAEPVKEQKSALPDDLVAKAKKLGISDEDISLYEKPGQLERLCSLLEPKATKPEAEKSEKEAAKETPAEDGEFKIELDPDLYDPDLCKAMKSTADQINGLKSIVNNVMSMMQRQSEKTFESTFEGFIAELGDGFSDTLGKGTLDEIGRDSEHFQNRCKVIEEMNAIAAGYSQTGKAVPSPKQLFTRAVNSIFGDTIRKSARREVAGQLQKRSAQIISRPTGRNGKDTQTPDQRATNAVRDKLREFGALEHDEAEEEF